jgi:dTDP-glucose pyrophosphorylase
VSSGIKDIAIILGENHPELVKEHYGDGSKFGCRITYIYQGKPLGVAHAVGLCKEIKNLRKKYFRCNDCWLSCHKIFDISVIENRTVPKRLINTVLKMIMR